MTFLWFDFLQFVALVALFITAYRSFQRRRFKLAIFFGGALLLLALSPPVNFSKKGWGEVERRNPSMEVVLPEKKESPREELSFEEKVNLDITNLRKTRKGEESNVENN